MKAPSVTATVTSASPSPFTFGQPACEVWGSSVPGFSDIAPLQDAKFPHISVQLDENPDTRTLRRRWFHTNWFSEDASAARPAKDDYHWRRPWASLVLSAGVMVLSLSVWFSSTAFLDEICGDYGIGPSQASLLTVAVNVGFAVGATASAAAQLPDRVLTSRLLLVGSLGSSACNALLASPDVPFAALLAARLLNGAALSLVYPVLMRHVSSWFKPAKRGIALGCTLGSLVLGIALPNLLRALLPQTPWRAVVLCASGLALLGAVLSQGVQDGPHIQRQPAFSADGACLVMCCRSWQLVTLSYIGHSLELFGGWAWIDAFLREHFETRGIDAGLGDAASFAVVAIGVPGCIVGGWVADRFGRRTAIVSSHVTSGLAIAVLPSLAASGAPTWLVLLVAAVWGFATIADSAQYSALISDVLPTKQLLGTAMAMSLALGFLSTAAGIFVVPLLFEWGGWGRAFPCLALGSLAGLCAIACVQPAAPEPPAPAPASTLSSHS